MQTKEVRVRCWSFIVYPDSVLKNWREFLQEENVPFAVSPLHQPEPTEDGEERKAHYHVMVRFSGNKSFFQVKELTDSINATIPQRVKDVKAYIRYLIHYDNPEKEQFNKDPNMIERYCGFKLGNSFEMDSFDSEASLMDLFTYIQDNGIIEFSELIDVLISNGENDFFNLATKKYTLAVTRYLTSYRFRLEREDNREINELVSDRANAENTIINNKGVDCDD